ncbi:MAG TPA: type VII secretion protein EccCa [Streptosporangiaceae bacterium]
MSTTLFRRPARRQPPEMPSGELSLQEPPVMPEEPTGNLGLLLTFLPMALGSSMMILLFVTPGKGSGATTWLAGGLMMVTTMSMMVGQMGKTTSSRKRRTKGERRDYLRYLGQTRKKVRQQTAQQRRALAWIHPDPTALWWVAMSARLWERRPGHPDFADIRIGTGPQLFAVKINPMQTKPVEDLEPLCARALRRFISAHATVADQPVAVFLRSFAQIFLTGDPDLARSAARAALTQLLVLHAPEDLRIAACCSEQTAADWEWIKWLPHSQHASEADAAGPVRALRPALGEVVALFGEEFAERPRHEPGAAPSREEPYVVVILDGGDVSDETRFVTAGYRNAVLIDVGATVGWRHSKRVLRLDFTADDDAAGAEGPRLDMVQANRSGKEIRTCVGRGDVLSVEHARACARIVSPFRLGVTTEISEPLATDFDVAKLLNIGDVGTFDPRPLWAARTAADRLRVPIGIDEDGGVVELDIKEPAQGGNGPHGVLIGATGSGKSELLRTLVLSMAITHSSETLNFVLVDFKGGATFIGLDQLPHTSALITNLADEVQLVARMQESLQGELVRRQELLRRAGNYNSALDYEKARAQGAPLDPLPTLFVVVDEFSELLSAHREFIDLFVMIGRLGRSLGVHLLLASQRLDDGRIHQLESHLSYRIGLRTFSSMESRAVIGVPDAYELPARPGSGYMRIDNSTLIRFKAAYVSGPYRAATSKRQRIEAVRQLVVPYVTDHIASRGPGQGGAAASPDEPAGDNHTDPAGQDAGGEGGTLLEMMIDRIAGKGPAAHQVWLPPLPASPPLDEIMPALEPIPGVGLAPVDWAGRGGLVVPIGVVDRPFDQVRDLLMADLSGVGGHAGIVGRAQGGKSTLLRTLISSIALTHTPVQAHFYCLDFGGGMLASIADLPHVGSVATRLETDLVNRTIAEITALVTSRERRFGEHAIATMAAYRQQRAAGKFSEDPHGDVFLVIDGWTTFKTDFEPLEAALRQVLPRMLNYGVHLIVCANRWIELHSSVRDQIGTKLELRLGDPLESVIDIRASKNVPELPGRGLTTGKLQFLGALPRIDGSSETADSEDGLAALVANIGDCWSGAVAPKVRMLPDKLGVEELPPPEGKLKVAIGWSETDLAPVWHDFRTTAHLTILGDTESGKTNLLRLVARAVTRCYTPDEARVFLVDLRRELYDAVPAEYRLGYAVSAAVASQVVTDIAAQLRDRVPGQDITPEQLRRRDWWSGPEMFLLIDDYDLVASSASSPLQPLVDFLPQAGDIGLHVVIARGAAGSMRTSMDPVLRRLGESNTPDLALSCPPSEGPLLGNVRPRQFPPGRAMLLSRRGFRILQTAFVGDQDKS